MLDAYERLGLAPGAETREIRKAYARELKKIDQEQDPQGFQELRWAYECALGDGAVTPPLPVPPPTKPPVLDISPQQHAQRAWALCQRRMADKAGLTTWELELQSALEDDAFINIESRHCFEGLVVEMLADGWQPGNETLFLAATLVFNWEGSSNNLALFSEAGQLINLALKELRLLQGLPAQERDQLRLTMMRLQNSLPLTPDELDYHRMPLMLLHQAAPALMQITMETERYGYWLAESLNAPPPSPPASQSEPRRSVAMKSLIVLAVWTVFVFGIAYCSPHQQAPVIITPPP